MAEKNELKNLFKVYFVDGSFKSFKINPKETTVEELWEMVATKLGLSEEHSQYFFIWGIEEDLELLLFSESTLDEVINEWPGYMKKWSLRKQEEEQTNKNLLKKTVKGKLDQQFFWKNQNFDKNLSTL